MAGYSSTPLAKKLGIKDGCRLKLVNAPEDYRSFFTDMPSGLAINQAGTANNDIIHFFTKSASEILQTLPLLKKQIVQNGAIWISWPKKSAKVITDVTENLIRDIALKAGLVDVKVCAVSEMWSGLKLVIPLKSRT